MNTAIPTMAEAEATAAIIRERAPGFVPKLAIILGSGLGALADQIEKPQRISYGDLPGFPHTTVMGHAGQLILGELNGCKVICMAGRGHYYEGHGIGVMATPIRTLKLLGTEILCITGAVGGLLPDAPPGSLLAISDTINLMGTSPLIGANDTRIGPRFMPMDNAWDAALRQKLHKAARSENIPLRDGVYLAVHGPSFETAAEIRAFRILGADMVGMSVVPDCILARHCGLKVVGAGLVTNFATGISDEPFDHNSVLETAKQGSDDFIRLIKNFAGTLS